jgi:hypothetical protein
MSLLLVNCDDVGMHPSVNDAVVRLLAEGRVRSASLMPVGRYFDDAAARLRGVGVRDIGVHLTLGSEYAALPTAPLAGTAAVPTLVGPDGAFHPDIAPVRDRIDPSEVALELSLQIRRVREAGFGISHLDGHMFFYERDVGGPWLFDLVQRMACDLDVPFRGDGRGVPRVFIWEDVPDPDDRLRVYRSLVTAPRTAPCEVVVHPASDLAALRPITRSAAWRHTDFRAFVASTLDEMMSPGETFLSWGDLAARRDGGCAAWDPNLWSDPYR